MAFSGIPVIYILHVQCFIMYPSLLHLFPLKKKNILVLYFIVICKIFPYLIFYFETLLFVCVCALYFLFFLLYNTVLVSPYIYMNLPRFSWVPNPEPPSHHPPHKHLSGSSQCTSHKHPVSCIEPRLAIHFLHDSIHVFLNVGC